MTSKVEIIDNFSLGAVRRKNGRVEPMPPPEVTKESRKWKFFTRFRDNVDEKLYRVYFTRQKFDTVDSFIIFSALFAICILVIEALRFSDAKIAKASLFCVFIFMNMLIFVLCRLPKIASRVRAVASLGIWCLFFVEIFVDLALDWNTTFPSDGVTWIVVLVYLTYIMLPTRLLVCIVLSSLVSLGQVCLVVALCFQRKNNVTLIGNQVGANLCLFVCSHLLGVLSYLHSDLQQRRSFLETKSSLSVKVTIEKESKQQERLLLSVLPKHVASEMLRDWGEGGGGQFRKIFLTRYENVSILFADIVGFTAISSSCTAAELVKILNELFATFDKLASKFHQHRIKILGDCYYCVCGAPDPRPDHAVLCIHMGLNVVDAITYVREKTKKDVNMRVGIHTGAVLGGVLGQRQWQYDVLGKEVILANMMESGGIPGRVHISETTQSFLHDEFELEPGNGDSREDHIRLLGIKTYLVKSVLKPLKPDVTNDVSLPKAKDTSSTTNGYSKAGSKANAVVSIIDEEEETELMNTPEALTLGADGSFHGNEKDMEKQLQEALLERDSQGGTSKQLHPLSMRFNDRRLETQYQTRREKFSGMGAVGLCLVALFTFLARLCVLPISGYATLSFIVGTIVLVAMTAVVIAANASSPCPNCMVWFANWVTENVVIRILWTGLLVLVLAATDITAMFGCSLTSSVNVTTGPWLVPEDPLCRYPPYFIHSGSLVLIGTAGLVQIGQLVKLILVVVIATVYCLLDMLVMSSLFDLYDSSVYTQFEREHMLLPSKYRLTGAFITLALAVIYFGRQTDFTSRRLFYWTEEAEKQKEQVTQLRIKNEALVYNLLPGHVAKDFLGSQKNDEELYSHAYDEVGVIFAACPNFHDFYNESSVNNNGLECFRFLNEIISDYDELLEQATFSSVCKIKTVGPTYMAASGMANTTHVTKSTSMRERWQHLDDLVQFAFCMKETLQRINEQSFNNFILRIGINHGPVIAGVIGARKPHYDIWGNTVNVASRMESTGHAGKIQVVEETMVILKAFGYNFQKRGFIKVKGKGELMTYFVENRQKDSQTYQ